MNITRENIAPLHDVLTVTITPEDYAAKVEKKLKDYQKQAVIPGFRPGKVPAQVIKKRVGKDLTAEIVTNAMAEALDSYMAENNIRYFGQPIPYKPEEYSYDWENQTEFVFAYELGLTPEVSFSIADLPKFKYYTIEAGDADVEEYVNNLTERLTNETKVDEPAGEKDVVFGELKADDLLTGETFYLNEATDFVRQSLLGKKEGDVVTFQKDEIFADAAKLADTFKISEEQAATVAGPFTFTVKEVRRATKPELNQEFFDKVMGPGKVSSEEEFRAQLKSNIVSDWERESNYKFDFDVRNYLTSTIKVELPEAFLRNWIPTVSKEAMDADKLETELVNLKKYLRWSVIEGRLLQDNGIQITMDDLQAEAAEAVKNMFRMYGLPDRDDDSFYQDQAKRLLENEEQRQRYLDQAKNKKLFNLFKTALQVENVTIDKEAFKKMIEDEAKELEVAAL